MATIKFKSNVKQGGSIVPIEFTAPVVSSHFGDFRVFEFQEPSSKVLNRIEISKNEVNIFAGVSSINLKLKNSVKIKYDTPHGIVHLVSNMSKLIIKNENNINFKYTLASEDEIVGEYDITLTISK